MSTDGRLLDVAAGSNRAVLMWPWFLTALDDWGRMRWDARSFKLEVFPGLDEVTVEECQRAADLFVANGLLQRYVVDGREYLAVAKIETWWKYQTYVHRDKRSKDTSRNPPPPEISTDSETPADFRGFPRDSAELREVPRDPASLGRLYTPSSLPPFSKEELQPPESCTTPQVSLVAVGDESPEPVPETDEESTEAVVAELFGPGETAEPPTVPPETIQQNGHDHHPQRARVGAVQQLFTGEKPSGGLVAKWLKLVGFERLRELILCLGPRASHDPWNYLAKCVNNLHTNLDDEPVDSPVTDQEREALRALFETFETPQSRGQVA